VLVGLATYAADEGFPMDILEFQKAQARTEDMLLGLFHAS
jgi:hypothetical protein